MELLYAWINQDKNGFISKQGFNFSPQFRFDMVKEENVWILRMNQAWENNKSIFKTDVIENVTAIIGDNGVGKTTLLNWLKPLSCLPHRKSEREEYLEYDKKETLEHLAVLIFNDNGELKIFHTFDESNFNNQINLSRTYNMNDSQLVQNIISSNLEVFNITKIYLTNSSYTEKDGISQAGKLNSVVFSPNALKVIANSFYDLDGNRIQFIKSNSLLEKWNRILKKYQDAEAFQQICDVLYFNILLKNNTFSSYNGKICTDLEIFSKNVVSILDKEYNEFHSAVGSEVDFYKYYVNQKNLIPMIDKTIPYVINALLLNLIFEVCIYFNIELAVKQNRVIDINFIKEWVTNICQEKNKKNETDRDFITDLSEILELSKIIGKSEAYNNSLPESDLGFRSTRIISFERSKKGYRTFVQFIQKAFDSKKSFVLKYIEIINLQMSSGERAYQNFFSWINLVPQFHKVSKYIPEQLNDTILLLIDEIDLYLHPLWQKNFMDFFLDEIERQFKDYKVQIIFTTHSPICLSDIPVQNTIHLRRINGKCIVDNSLHNQTFAVDVFRILNDSFYLQDSTMGSYAKKRIDILAKKIWNEELNQYNQMSMEEYDLIIKEIEYIGNDLLKYKLKEMLLNCIAKDNKANSIRKQIQKMKKELELLEVHDDTNTIL